MHIAYEKYIVLMMMFADISYNNIMEEKKSG
jgi:hypothetical protein